MRCRNKPGLRNRRNKNEFDSGLQPSEQGPDVDTPPLRDGAEIIRAFSPFGQWFMVMQGYPNANFANERESTRITVFVIPNATLCHSERSEESRGEKERDSSLRSE